MTEYVRNFEKRHSTRRRCKLCKSPNFELNEWFNHLVRKTHQQRARRNFLEWTSEVTTMSVVIFTDFPVVSGYTAGNVLEQDFAGVVTALQAISDKVGPEDCAIQDFVAWEQQPFVGIVMLESITYIKKLFGQSIRCEDKLSILLDDDGSHFVKVRLMNTVPLHAILPEEAYMDFKSECFQGQSGPDSGLQFSDIYVVSENGKRIRELTVEDDDGHADSKDEESALGLSKDTKKQKLVKWEIDLTQDEGQEVPGYMEWALRKFPMVV